MLGGFRYMEAFVNHCARVKTPSGIYSTSSTRRIIRCSTHPLQVHSRSDCSSRTSGATFCDLVMEAIEFQAPFACSSKTHLKTCHNIKLVVWNGTDVPSWAWPDACLAELTTRTRSMGGYLIAATAVLIYRLPGTSQGYRRRFTPLLLQYYSTTVPHVRQESLSLILDDHVEASLRARWGLYTQNLLQATHRPREELLIGYYGDKTDLQRVESRHRSGSLKLLFIEETTVNCTPSRYVTRRRGQPPRASWWCNTGLSRPTRSAAQIRSDFVLETYHGGAADGPPGTPGPTVVAERVRPVRLQGVVHE